MELKEILIGLVALGIIIAGIAFAWDWVSKRRKKNKSPEEKARQKALTDYTLTMNRHPDGPESAEAIAFFEQHKHLPKFEPLANTAADLWRVFRRCEPALVHAKVESDESGVRDPLREYATLLCDTIGGPISPEAAAFRVKYKDNKELSELLRMTDLLWGLCRPHKSA